MNEINDIDLTFSVSSNDTSVNSNNYNKFYISPDKNLQVGSRKFDEYEGEIRSTENFLDSTTFFDSNSNENDLSNDFNTNQINSSNVLLRSTMHETTQSFRDYQDTNLKKKVEAYYQDIMKSLAINDIINSMKLPFLSEKLKPPEYLANKTNFNEINDLVQQSTSINPQSRRQSTVANSSLPPINRSGGSMYSTVSGISAISDASTGYKPNRSRKSFVGENSMRSRSESVLEKQTILTQSNSIPITSRSNLSANSRGSKGSQKGSISSSSTSKNYDNNENILKKILTLLEEATTHIDPSTIYFECGRLFRSISVYDRSIYCYEKASLLKSNPEEIVEKFYFYNDMIKTSMDSNDNNPLKLDINEKELIKQFNNKNIQSKPKDFVLTFPKSNIKNEFSNEYELKKYIYNKKLSRMSPIFLPNFLKLRENRRKELEYNEKERLRLLKRACHSELTYLYLLTSLKNIHKAKKNILMALKCCINEIEYKEMLEYCHLLIISYSVSYYFFSFILSLFSLYYFLI